MRRALRPLLLALLVVAGSVAGGYLYQATSDAGEAIAEPRPVAPPRSATELEAALVAASAAARPAVVSIATEHTIRLPGRRNPLADDPFFRRFFGDWLIPPQEGVRSGLGSGFLIEAEGLVVTNAHVVEAPRGAESNEITVRLADGRERKAEVVGSDEETDIALLRLERKGGETFPYLTLGNSDDLEIGQIVLVIGTPFDKRLSQTVTMGIVSSKGRSGLGIEAFEDFIQTDAAINPGNSGGPMVDLEGEVVGMSTAITTRGGDFAGVGFAIPSNLIRFVVENLRQGKKVARGYLGVRLQNLTEGMAEELGVPVAEGAVVSEVLEGTPAEAAGLRAGDVIVEWNGRKIRSAGALTAAVTTTPIGSEATVVFYRGGNRVTRRVTVGERPNDLAASARGEGEWIGPLRIRVKPGEVGLAITSIADDSPLAGEVREGDEIVAVSRERVTTVEELRRALEGRTRALLQIETEGGRYFLIVPLAE